MKRFIFLKCLAAMICIIAIVAMGVAAFNCQKIVFEISATVLFLLAVGMIIAEYFIEKHRQRSDFYHKDARLYSSVTDRFSVRGGGVVCLCLAEPNPPRSDQLAPLFGEIFLKMPVTAVAVCGLNATDRLIEYLNEVDGDITMFFVGEAASNSAKIYSQLSHRIQKIVFYDSPTQMQRSLYFYDCKRGILFSEGHSTKNSTKRVPGCEYYSTGSTKVCYMGEAHPPVVTAIVRSMS